MTGELPGQVPLSHASEFSIGSEHIDSNRHVNNASYIKLFQTARRDLLTANATSLNYLLGDGPRVAQYVGGFRKEVFEGDKVQVETTLDKKGATISFAEGMKRDGQLASYLVYEVHHPEPSDGEPQLEHQRFSYLVLKDEATDENDEQNEGYLLEEYEAQRGAYLYSHGYDADVVEREFGALYVISRFNGRFSKPVEPGQIVSIGTSITTSPIGTADQKKDILKFSQIMFSGDEEVGRFNCDVLAIDAQTRAWVSMPGEIVEAVNSSTISNNK